ncbi:MAG: hypothetical protein JNK86_04010 [Alphaproteobacteria bacterium]|nr:hypothetical protein [Alphaproteobacteria bacterium]
MMSAVQDSFYVTFVPLISFGVLFGIAILWILLLAFSLYKGQKGVWWRCLAAGLFLLALLNPQSVEEKKAAKNSVGIILVDDSGSQSLADRAQQTELAIKRILDQQQQQIDIKVIRLSELGEQYRGSTMIGAALQQILRDITTTNLAGVVIISDGQIHDANLFQQLRLSVPVHLLLTGSSKEKDRRLKILDTPVFSLVGQQITLTVQLDEVPLTTNEPVNLHIRQQDKLLPNIMIKPGVEQKLTLTIDQVGQNIIELWVDPVDGELTALNNRTALAINGIRDRLRVLLVSGEPYPGERVWRNLLKSDPAVDLIHFTILRPPEVRDTTPENELSLIPFPVDELFVRRLKDFDLIIFDRYYRQGLLPRTYFDNIVKYVEEGGAFFETSGPQYATQMGLYTSPLAKLLPGKPTGVLIERGFLPNISELGRRHPITSGLQQPKEEKPSWGRWFRQVEVQVAEGDVLMTGAQNKPLLVVRRVGKGRVAQLLSDHIWLWSRGFEGGGPQAELLRRLAHWLMKEPQLEEESLTGKIVDGNIEITRRSLKNTPITLQVTDPVGDKTQHLITPNSDGLSFIRLPADLPGIYRLQDSQFTVLVANGLSEAKEFSDVISTSTIVKPLVDQNKGTIIRLSDYPNFNWQIIPKNRDAGGRNWFGLYAQDNFQVIGINQTDLLSPYILVVLGIIATFMAWYREGRV